MTLDDIYGRQESLFRWAEAAFKERGGPFEGSPDIAMLMAALLRDLQDHHYAKLPDKGR